MKKMFMAVIALMMTLSASAQFYIYFSNGAVAKVDSISMIAPIVDYVVTLSETTLVMDLASNKSAKLNATVTPADCPYSLLWTSSNPEVATVDDSGRVKAISVGSTTITVTLNTSADDPTVGTVTAATCVVKVVEPVDYVVTLSETTLLMDLASNKSAKLNATVTPADCPYSLLWTSDNPEVATVNASGIVEAVNFGTAVITVTLNTSADDLAVGTVTPATCVVNVTNDAVLNTFELGGYAIFDLGSPIAGTDTLIELSVGEVTCQLAPSLYYIWDKGITLVNNSLSGAGFILPVETYAYVITESPNGAYNGYYISGFDIVVDTIDDALAFSSQYGVSAAPYGQLLDVDMYGRAWDGILAAGNEAQMEAARELYYVSQTGTQFFHVDFNTGSNSYNYGNLSYLYLTEDRETGELYYDLKLEWYDHVNEGRWYGLLAEIEFDEDGGEYLTGFVKPYDMRFIHKQYQVLPPVESNQAPAMMPKKNVLVPKKMIEWNIEKLSNLPRIK